MDEDLRLHVGVLVDVPDLLFGELPGQHHPLAAQSLGLQHAGQVVDGHLGGGVDGQVWGAGFHHFGNAQVLDQQGIHPQAGSGFNGRHHLVSLLVKHDGV